MGCSFELFFIKVGFMLVFVGGKVLVFFVFLSGSVLFFVVFIILVGCLFVFGFVFVLGVKWFVDWIIVLCGV